MAGLFLFRVMSGTWYMTHIVHNKKAVVVKSDAFAAPNKETIKQIINDVIEKLRT